MDREKEPLLYDYLKDIQILSHYPIITQDPITHDFRIKSGGTKQGVYSHMVHIRNNVDFILKYFFQEEAEDDIKEL